MATHLVELTREPLVECIHSGDVAIVDLEGSLRYHVGNPYQVTYMRSSAKPIQGLELILSGAADRYQFTEPELAIMCSSHYGESFHVEALNTILDKIELRESTLLCGPVMSYNIEAALSAAWNGDKPRNLFNDCSGKHLAELAVCLHKSYDPSGYIEPDHPVQQDILNNVAYMTGMERSHIHVGIDNCSVPVLGMPIFNMAYSFARFSNPHLLDSEYTQACQRIYQAMTHNPEMIAGTGGFCTELMKHTHGKLFSKLGAEGVYCVGVKDRGIGIALKIADGGVRAIPSVVVPILDELGILNDSEREALASWAIQPNRNDVGKQVGVYRPVFRLVTD
jgi:L-asparaginase II